MKTERNTFVMLLLFCLILFTNCKSDEEIFFAAIQENSIEEVNGLIEDGFDINIIDENGQTGLMHASSLGQIEIVQILLDNNADILLTDSKGKSAYDLAIANDQVDITILLLSQGEQVNEKYWVDNKAGLTLKEEPDEYSETLGIMNHADEVTVTLKSIINTTASEKTGNWYKAEWNNFEGWIFNDGVSLSMSEIKITGTIRGYIGYPGQGVPDMTIYAEELATGTINSTESFRQDEYGYQYYSIDVTPGNYIVYASLSGSRTIIGYYTKYSELDGSYDIYNPPVGLHTPVIIDVKLYDNIDNINITDYYTSDHLITYFQTYNYDLHGTWIALEPSEEIDGENIYSSIQFCMFQKDSEWLESSQDSKYEDKFLIIYDFIPIRTATLVIDDFSGEDETLILIVEDISFDKEIEISVNFIDENQIYVVSSKDDEYSPIDGIFNRRDN